MAKGATSKGGNNQAMTDALLAIYYHCERPRFLGRATAFDERGRATTGEARRTDEVTVAAMIPPMSRALDDFHDLVDMLAERRDVSQHRNVRITSLAPATVRLRVDQGPSS
jgi:hypothetical protein